MCLNRMELVRIINLVEKTKKINFHFNLIVNCLIWFSLSYITFRYGESLNQFGKESLELFEKHQESVYKLNFTLFLSITSIALIFKRARAVMIAIIVSLVVLYFGNSLLLELRGTPLIWADLFLIKEGIGMINNYGLNKYIVHIILGIISFILILGIIFIKEKPKSKLKFINPIGIIICVYMVILSNNIYNECKEENKINIMKWDMNASYKINGFLLTFLSTREGFQVEKPTSYNGNEINDIISDIKTEEATNDDPNLIFVQLESFIDPMRIKEATLIEDPIPSFRKFYREYTSGLIQAPTFGGGTVRTEFEMLTGLSTDYLPVGAIPNNDILKKEPIESMAQVLGDDGYETSIVHNYTGSFFDRDVVMRNYGFDNFISKEYMGVPGNYGQAYPDDLLNIQTIESLLANNETPQFIYNITVETHGAYSSEPTEIKYVSQEGLSDLERNELEYYCKKIAGVDAYINKLIEVINNLNRPTVVVFFSDHLPSMSVINRQDSSIDSVNRYYSEAIVWDNIEEKHTKENIQLEAYQLSTYVFNRYGFKVGMINGFHSSYMNKENYQEALQNLQYDIIYGKKYYSDGTNPYEKASTRYGLKDISLENCYLENDTVIIKGKNFTYLSKITVDDKIIDVKYIDENTLHVDSAIMKKGQVKVAQVGVIGSYQKVISASNSVLYE